MRMMLEIDDDILEAVQRLATAEGTSTGKALSDLARRTLEREFPPTRFPAFDVPPDAPPITRDHVNNALDEE
jgi:hypothetical protein